MKDTDLIKQKIDIVEFINEYVPLKKAGRNFQALCPFHSEKTPSFNVSPDRQIWHCFGACNEGGDIFTFLMKRENIEFPEALRELALRAGIELSSPVEQDERLKHIDRLYEINHLASEYYHYLLTKHASGSRAREYLRKRNVPEKLMNTFMLGYAPDGWRNVYPYLKKKRYADEEIVMAGLAIKGDGNYYDRFRGRIIFTLADHRGKIAGFSGRLLKESGEAKYINTPETPVYHKGSLLYGLNVTRDAIRKAESVIVCEGEFDVLSSYREGISNIVAIKGTALTEEQLRLLKRFTNEIRLALDMDFAGDQAARRSIALADELDFTIRVVELPEGKDLDEGLIVNPTAVKQAVNHAASVYDFMLHSARKRYDVTDPYGKKMFAREVLPLFARIINPIVQHHYVKQVAEFLSVSEASILAEIEKETKRRSSIPVPPRQLSNGEQPLTRQERLEQHLLALIVQARNPHEYLKRTIQTLTIDSISSKPVRRIFMILHEKMPDLKLIDHVLPTELTDTYNRAYLKDIRTLLADEQIFDKEFLQTVRELRKLQIKQRISEIGKGMKKKEDLSVLNSEFGKLSEELKKISQRSK